MGWREARLCTGLCRYQWCSWCGEEVLKGSARLKYRSPAAHRGSLAVSQRVGAQARSARIGVGGRRLNQEALARDDKRQGEQRDRGHYGEHGDGVLEMGLHSTHSFARSLAGLGERDTG